MKLLKLIRSKYFQILNRNKNDICANCIWHKSEEENSVPIINHVRFCDKYSKYTPSYYSCDGFKKEYFHAKETLNPTSTDEIMINTKFEVSKSDMETKNNND